MSFLPAILQPTVLGHVLRYLLRPCPCHHAANPLIELRLASRMVYAAISDEKALLAQVDRQLTLAKIPTGLSYPTYWTDHLDDDDDGNHHLVTLPLSCCLFRRQPVVHPTVWSRLSEASKAGVAEMMRRRFRQRGTNRELREEQFAIEIHYPYLVDDIEPPLHISHYHLCSKFRNGDVDESTFIAGIEAGIVQHEHLIIDGNVLSEQRYPGFVMDMRSMIRYRKPDMAVLILEALTRKRMALKWWHFLPSSFAGLWVDDQVGIALLKAVADGTLRVPFPQGHEGVRETLRSLEMLIKLRTRRCSVSYLLTWIRHDRKLWNGLMARVTDAGMSRLLLNDEMKRLGRFWALQQECTAVCPRFKRKFELYRE